MSGRAEAGAGAAVASAARDEVDPGGCVVMMQLVLIIVSSVNITNIPAFGLSFVLICELSSRRARGRGCRQAIGACGLAFCVAAMYALGMYVVCAIVDIESQIAADHACTLLSTSSTDYPVHDRSFIVIGVGLMLYYTQGAAALLYASYGVILLVSGSGRVGVGSPRLRIFPRRPRSDSNSTQPNTDDASSESSTLGDVASQASLSNWVARRTEMARQTAQRDDQSGTSIPVGLPVAAGQASTPYAQPNTHFVMGFEVGYQVAVSSVGQGGAGQGGATSHGVHV